MTKIIQPPQQRANTLEALNVMWPSVPPENVSNRLSLWSTAKVDPETLKGSAPNCGTAACFGGWCAWWPAFRNQGVRVGFGGRPALDGSESADCAALHLFGCSRIFLMRNEWEGVDWDFYGTDHELVTYRLQWLLDNSEVQS